MSSLHLYLNVVVQSISNTCIPPHRLHSHRFFPTHSQSRQSSHTADRPVLDQLILKLKLKFVKICGFYYVIWDKDNLPKATGKTTCKCGVVGTYGSIHWTVCIRVTPCDKEQSKNFKSNHYCQINANRVGLSSCWPEEWNKNASLLSSHLSCSRIQHTIHNYRSQESSKRWCKRFVWQQTNLTESIKTKT